MDKSPAAFPGAGFTIIRRHRLLLGVLLVTGLIELLRFYSLDALVFERDHLASGQGWRLVTGNLCHMGPSHWVLNMAGWAMGWWIYRSFFTEAQWLWLLLVSSLFVGFGLWFFTDVQSYVGLSGTLHGVFVAAAVADIRFGWRLGGWLMLVAICAKLLFEQLVGSLPGTTQMSGGNVIVDAHLFGAVGGISWVMALYAVQWWRRGCSHDRAAADKRDSTAG